MQSDLTARKVRVEGRVQGVGFRAFVRDAARAAGVVGEIRNLSDGSVEALLIGTEAEAERVVAAIRRGPPGSAVESMASEAVEPSETPEAFSIAR